MAMGTPDVLAGRYERRGVLGQGGMATVYDAWDRRLERAVALKILRPEVATDLTARARFEAEARAAATLNHPNVVTVYDSGEDQGVAFLVMERLPGHTLRHEIARGRLSPDRLRGLLGDVLAAVGTAHSAGIVHRDIKPGNVLFANDGSTKVTDFGIAKSVGVDLTGTGELIGTAAYLAPERLEGAPATALSDIYAVGVLAYEALTGRKPFEADTPLALARAIAEHPPPPLEASGVDVEGSLAAAIERAMAKQPEERFPTASAMAAALGLPTRTAALAREAPVEAAPPLETEAAIEEEEAAPQAEAELEPEPGPAPEPQPEPPADEPESSYEPESPYEPESSYEPEPEPVGAPPTEPYLVAAAAEEVAVEDPPTTPLDPTEVDRTEVAPVPGPIYEPEPAPEAPASEPEPAEQIPRPGERESVDRRGVGLIAAAVAVVVIATALGIAMTRGGGSKPKVAAGRPTPTTSTTIEQPLADVPLKDLMPVVRTLNTGLALRAFASNRQPILEITDLERIISSSTSPVDDRALYGAHPISGIAAVAWANRPSANSEVLLQVSKFATPQDAVAARVRFRQQEEGRLERLARIQDRTFESQTHPALGQIDVARFFDPSGGRVVNGKAGAALVTRHRGTKGQYLFEIRTRQTAGSDHKPTSPVVDPAPSVAEVLNRLADMFDAKLNPQSNP